MWILVRKVSQARQNDFSTTIAFLKFNIFLLLTLKSYSRPYTIIDGWK